MELVLMGVNYTPGIDILPPLAFVIGAAFILFMLYFYANQQWPKKIFVVHRGDTEQQTSRRIYGGCKIIPDDMIKAFLEGDKLIGEGDFTKFQPTRSISAGLLGNKITTRYHCVKVGPFLFPTMEIDVPKPSAVNKIKGIASSLFGLSNNINVKGELLIPYEQDINVSEKSFLEALAAANIASSTINHFFKAQQFTEQKNPYTNMILLVLATCVPILIISAVLYFSVAAISADNLKATTVLASAIHGSVTGDFSDYYKLMNSTDSKQLGTTTGDVIGNVIPKPS